MSTETPLEFTKLSEVEIVDTLSSEDTVLIEQNSEIKRVTKDNIGAQSDWNETDETSLSFIKNKPELGFSHITQLYGYDNGSGFVLGYEQIRPFESRITSSEEFYDLYTTKPIMVHMVDMYGESLGVSTYIIGYDNTNNKIYFCGGEQSWNLVM